MQRKIEESYVRGFKPVSKDSELFQSNPQTIVDCLRFWASKIPDDDAFVFRSTTGQKFKITWKEFYDRVSKMAMAYKKMGIKRGDVIAIVTRTSPEWIYVVFGAFAAGITVTTIVFTYDDGSDVIEMMGRLRTCSLLVMDPGLKESNWKIFTNLIDNYDADGNVSSTKMPYLRKLVFVSMPENVSGRTVVDLLGEDYDIDLPVVDPDYIAILFQTSGSTGVPKPVGHTQKTLLSFGKASQNTGAFTGKVDFNDRPFAWIGGFPFGFLFGQTRITLSGTCPALENKLSFVIDTVIEEGCVSTIMLPPMIHELVRRRGELPDDWPLQTITTGGMPITKILASCIGKVCKRLVVAYGATEFLVPFIMSVESPDEFVDYSCGVPEHDVEVKVVDNSGNTVPVGERGEVYIRSLWVFREYYNNPEKTAAVKTPDGWYKTDDFARMNSDGYLFVEGRMSDIIICGGMNVTPAILETVMKACPGVYSACCVPVPNKEKHQLVCACVQRTSSSDVTEEQLREYMERKHNDEEKLFTVLPSYYMFLDKLPEEGTGKISRRVLKQMASEKFGDQ